MNQRNLVGALQQRAMAQGFLPKYELVRIEGESHCPTFTMSVTLGNLKCHGKGSSKKSAKFHTARAMMCMMDSASYSPPSSSSQAEDSLETSLPSVTKIEDKLKSLNL